MRSLIARTEFKQRCRGLAIEGVSLHSYRYAWAERALTVGYPERFSQEALGHNSKAVHRAYARKAKVIVPALESYEKNGIGGKIVKLPKPGQQLILTSPRGNNLFRHPLVETRRAFRFTRRFFTCASFSR